MNNKNSIDMGVKGIMSANIHVTGQCNYNCDHCFSRCLRGMRVLEPDEWRPHLEYLKQIGVTKVNIAGGEPFVYRKLEDLCRIIKAYGFTTTIVSNGSLIDDEWIERLDGIVDWFGLSIDSTSNEDEKRIGRCVNGLDHVENVREVMKKLKSKGFGVKLNITVTRDSWNKDFRDYIAEIDADRVKAFRALTLIGANDDRSDTWSITDDQFETFVERHKDCKNIIFEDNKDMIGTYLMFDPMGRWMVNNGGKKHFLPFEFLQKNGPSAKIDIKGYYDRGGFYEWDRQKSNLMGTSSTKQDSVSGGD